jgi:opacity protein-like surface antigen
MSFLKQISGLRSIAIAALLTVSSTAFSDCVEYCPPSCVEYCQPGCNWGDFYIGAGIEYKGNYFKTNDSSALFYPSDVGVFPNPSGTDNSVFRSLGAAQFLGDLIIGYSSPNWCRFNISVEGFISGAPKLQSESNLNRNIATLGGIPFNYLIEDYSTFHMNTFYGVAIKPGYQIWDDVTVFGRVGYVAGKAHLKLASRQIGTATIGFQTPAINTYEVNKTKTLHGVQAGLGFNIRLSDRIHMDMGYNWDRYNSMRTDVTTSDTTIFGDPFEQTKVLNRKIRPRSEAFVTSIQYHFCPSDCYVNCDPVCGNQEVYVGIVGDRDNSYLSKRSHRANGRPSTDRRGGFNNSSNIDDVVAKGWGVEAFAGYGYTFDCGIYGGIEGFYNYSPSKSDYKDTGLSTQGVSSAVNVTTNSTELIKLKDSYGVCILPGYKVNDHILIFLKLGWSQRRLHYKTTFSGVPSPQPRDVAVHNRSISRNINGYLIGTGIDIKICENLYIRNEYAVTAYSRKHLPRYTTPLLSGAGFFEAEDVSFDATSHEYKLGLVYKLPLCCRR